MAPAGVKQVFDEKSGKLAYGEQLARGFFGRRAGKALTRRQAFLMQDLLPQLKIDIHQAAPADVRSLFSRPVEQVWLESGFGGGEHLIHRAGENPHIGYIGVEPFRNGMAKALQAIADRKIANIRLYDEEAGSLLDWLPDEALDGFYLLYPDPWPKIRHFKRRFVNQKNLDRMARVLKQKGEFRLACDIESYIDWTLAHCADHPSFKWQEGTLDKTLQPWSGWPGTRYEAKALREGRRPRYLTFERQGEGDDA